MSTLVRSQIQQQLPELLRDRAFRKKVSEMVRREGKQITVTSPYKLQEKEIVALRDRLGISDSERELINEVDPSLIMGLIIKSNSYYVDYSLKGRIDGLLQSLK